MTEEKFNNTSNKEESKDKGYTDKSTSSAKAFHSKTTRDCIPKR